MNMKKIAFLPALLLTAASSAFAQDTDFSASATYAFESEFNFRGFQIAGDTFTPSAEGRINSGLDTYYFGVRTALPTEKDDNRVKMHEYYAGGEFHFGEKFAVDLGVSHYQFLPFSEDSATEGILGLTWKGPLNPSLYVYADTDGDMLTFEGSLGHAIVIDQKSALLFTGYVGTTEFHVGSNYAGFMIDYSYSFTRYARFAVGGRIARLDPDAPDAGDELVEADTRVWWGVSFTAGF